MEPTKKHEKVWNRVTFFRDDTTAIQVTVSRLDVAVPLYRFSVGTVTSRQAEDGESFDVFDPAIMLRKRQNMSLGAFGFEFDYAKLILDLLLQAQEWAITDCARAFNEQTEAQYAKDLQAANRGKPVTKTTGKTARKKERLLAKQKSA